MFPIRFSRLAAAFSEAKYGGVRVVEQRVRDEMSQQGIDPDKPFAMALTMSERRVGDDLENIEILLCLPDRGRDGGVVVDTAHWDVGPTLTEGPFKGRSLVMPVPDTDADDLYGYAKRSESELG